MVTEVTHTDVVTITTTIITDILKLVNVSKLGCNLFESRWLIYDLSNCSLTMGKLSVEEGAQVDATISMKSSKKLKALDAQQDNSTQSEKTA